MWSYNNKVLKKKRKKNDDEDSDDEDENGGTVKTIGNRIYFYGDVNSKNILELNYSKDNFIEINSLNNEIKKRKITKNSFCKICSNKKIS